MSKVDIFIFLFGQFKVLIYRGSNWKFCLNYEKRNNQSPECLATVVAIPLTAFGRLLHENPISFELSKNVSPFLDEKPFTSTSSGVARTLNMKKLLLVKLQPGFRVIDALNDRRICHYWLLPLALMFLTCIRANRKIVNEQSIPCQGFSLRPPDSKFCVHAQPRSNDFFSDTSNYSRRNLELLSAGR